MEEESGPFGYIVKIRAKPTWRLAVMSRMRSVWKTTPGVVAYIVAEDVKDPDVIWVTAFWEDGAILRESLKDFRVQDSLGAAEALIVSREKFIELRPVLAPVKL